MPIVAFLSPESRHQMSLYLAEGNAAFREKKATEFFKSVDWLPYDSLMADRWLQKLPLSLLRPLKRDVADYLASKAVAKTENAQKRDDYRLRIIEYFRHKIPHSDKLLLESLRDYELNLTGRDVNWRHHFTLDSFRRIDDFVDAVPDARLLRINQFRKDVDTYKKNYEKIKYAQTHAGEHGFSFDDWCEAMGDEIPLRGKPNNNHQHQRAHSTPMPKTPAMKAYETLQLQWGTPLDGVKKQFRRLTLTHHPDLPTGSEEKMKTLVSAYQEIQTYWRKVSQS